MRNLSFFTKADWTRGRGGNGVIRGKQMAEYLGAKLNPTEGYENDICIYVKSEPPKDFPKHSYLDVVDGEGRVGWLIEHPEIGVIVTSETGYAHVVNKLKRDDIILIPQHHCNYERVTRDRKDVTVAGVIGRPLSIECPIKDFRKRLKAIGMEFKIQSHYTGREDVVNFYKTIDVQVIWRHNKWPLKNSLKIVNACSFGIPTVASPEKNYSDMKGFYTPVNSIDEMIKEVKRLKAGWDAQRLIKKAEEYHIDNISKLYKKLK